MTFLALYLLFSSSLGGQPQSLQSGPTAADPSPARPSSQIPVPSPMQQSLRAIPEDNLAYPVFVEAGRSAGSGFYVDTEKEIFFITAKHVLFDLTSNELHSPTARLISYSKDAMDLTKNTIVLDLPQLRASNAFRVHTNQDVVAIKIMEHTQVAGLNTAVPGVTVAQSAKGGFLTVAMKTIKTFDQVLTGNDLMVFGYPISLGLQQAQLDPLRPLLRKGIVAGTNPVTRTIVLDCPVYFGNSGGPVLEIDHVGFGSSLSVIGIIDQYIPFVQQAGSNTIAIQLQTNSGYSLALPMDYVLELVK